MYLALYTKINMFSLYSVFTENMVYVIKNNHRTQFISSSTKLTNC